MTSFRTSAFVLGCVAALTWGLTGTFIKLLPGFTTLEVLSIRVLSAFVSTLVVFVFYPSLLSTAIQLIRRPTGLLLSSLMVFYYLFAVRAFQLAPVGDVTLVVGLSPILGLIIKAVLGKGIVRTEIVGVSISFIGLLLFIYPKVTGLGEEQSIYLTGLFFALLAACVSLGYAALFKHYSSLNKSIDPVAVSCATFAIGSMIIAPITVASSHLFLLEVVSDSRVAAISLGLGIIATAVPTFCYSYAAKYLSPILTTALNLVTPVSAAAIAFILLQETIPLLSIFGAVLIFVGIFLLSTAKPAVSQQSERL
ncbi:Integral membrane protein DUF6 [Synechococcus sp. PCC 7335]|uniref:DMT family transporter n=1 Tax=Synechococcus sp. (strain ATCC 29403 / PCC 7335) TaxID=91464 RepID=UPI00017EB89A|nr:DMT family transporter [Synechococcus sp. PCC 7335]EDX83735.1 Integral membrane protein DUF6 [Synechococcus sp. PCC 7335]